MSKYFIFLIVVTNTLFMTNVSAKTKECTVKPAYNIVVNPQFVQIVNDKTNLIIDATGSITLNNQSIKPKSIIRQDAIQLEHYLRQQLPSFENLAYQRLDQVNDAFAVAIREKLGSQNDLLDNLANLHTKLIALLKTAIITTDNTTYFYYQPFNNLKKEGEAIGRSTFYSIVGDSIIHFNFFKNYSTIKTIAKQEWKQQKIMLKQFDDHVCELVTDIDEQYNYLMIGLNYTP